MKKEKIRLPEIMLAIVFMNKDLLEKEADLLKGLIKRKLNVLTNEQIDLIKAEYAVERSGFDNEEEFIDHITRVAITTVASNCMTYEHRMEEAFLVNIYSTIKSLCYAKDI